MLFHFEMKIDDIKISFCENLKKWFDTKFEIDEKARTNKLAKFLNISQGYASNILAGRNCGDESWRRFVAQKIGIDYDTMIGIPKKPYSQNIVSFETAEEKKHYYITKEFENKQLAIEINEVLVKIEKIDKKTFERLCKQAKFELSELESPKKDKDKAAGE